MSTFSIRAAGIADLALLARHRRDMFRAMGYEDETALAGMESAFAAWVEPRIDSGEYLAWLVLSPQGQPVAGTGLWLMDWPPHMIGPGAPRANILNVWVEPEWRRRGLARRLIGIALDACRARGIRAVVLHASAEGRPLYESLGFAATNEMRLML